jgi:dihydroorotate dehydrogenase
MNIKPIEIGNHTISPLVVSTILDHSGRGNEFPLALLPSYQRLTQVILETGTTVIAKSSTFEKHIGNYEAWKPWTWNNIQNIGDDGLLNAYGLSNGGVKVNARAIAFACQIGLNVIPSFYIQFAHGLDRAIDETLAAIEIYGAEMGNYFWILELNLSCPNAEEEIRKNISDALACVAAIRFHHPNLCLIAKISIVHPYEFAQELIEAGVNIIHAINTIPYLMVYRTGPPSPLQSVGGGGVSGGPAFDQAYCYNAHLRQLVSAPLIMGCGVSCLDDVSSYFNVGADAVSICTVCRRKPEEAIRIIKECAA